MKKDIPKGKGVRKLTLEDQLPSCKCSPRGELYILAELSEGKRVVDIGCGYGRNRPIVEAVGGEWIGVEPFEGGQHTVVGDAENLPFDDCSVDVVVMDAVLEHIPDVSKAFREVARILKPRGRFVGYVAFMECFHEISYSHLSHKALEHYSVINGMYLEKVAGSGAYSFDYQFCVLLDPLPGTWLRRPIQMMVRGIFRAKTLGAYLYLRLIRRMASVDAKRKTERFYLMQCLKFSAGYNFDIRKK